MSTARGFHLVSPILSGLTLGTRASAVDLAAESSLANTNARLENVSPEEDGKKNRKERVIRFL